MPKKAPAPRKPAKKPSKPAKPSKPVTALATQKDTQPGATFPLEVDPAEIEAGLKKLKDEVVHWANKGRYTKVRFKFRGKPLLPDLPLAAVAAAEGLTFYWGGILRALIFNLAGKAVFDVELVNDSEKRIQRGKEELLAVNVDEALAHLREAQSMDRDNPNVFLNLGVALKLKGDRTAAWEALRHARELDQDGPVGKEAERIASTIQDVLPRAVP